MTANSDSGVESSQSQPARKKRILVRVGIALGIILVAVVATGTWYVLHYADRALPRTSVASESVSGLTRAEVEDVVAEKIAATTVNIDGEAGAHTASLSDLGVSLDEDAIVDDVFRPNSSIVKRFAALWSPRTIAPEADVSASAVQSYIESIIPDDVVAANDASIVVADDGESFTWTEATIGKTLSADEITAATETAVRTLSSQDLTLSYIDHVPRITNEDAEQLVAKAQELASIPVTIAYGDNSYSPRLTTRVAWVNLTPTDDKTLEVSADAVGEWVQKAADDFVNAEPVQGTRKVSSSGEVLQTIQQAHDGYTVTNVGEVSEGIVSALNSDSEYSGEFAADVVAAVWDDQPVAPGAENFYYKASPGEKWIDINLSNRTTTAYEGATPVIGPAYMVPGVPGFETVTGIYSVYLKLESQTMRGDNGDGTRYEVEGVPWILYFHGGYAIHGAYWRSTFGPGAAGGSHGCINLPVSTAKSFYDWAPNGTIVASHY
ncbi:MAG: L,D-transpeptidase family protein [Actinomycetaceae bacterium]|nr:L,D-transpeptidase family protein [Actinomycetaceae bacterium]